MKTPGRGLGGFLRLVLILSQVFLTSSVSAVSVRWRGADSDALPVQPSSPADPEVLAGRLQAVFGGAAGRWADGRGGEKRHIVVQLAGAVRDEDRPALERQGLKLLTYLDQNCFFASMKPRGDARALARAGVADVAVVRREWKLHPALAAGAPPEWAVVRASVKKMPASEESDSAEERSLAAAYVLFHSDVPLTPDAEAICWAHNAVVRSRVPSVNGLVIELPLADVPALADEDAVQWIEPPLPRMEEVNDGVRYISQTDIAQSVGYALDGRNVTVLLYDAGTAWASHVDFGGRVTARDASGVNYHATHVAGTIGGSGSASTGLYRGTATGVTIESYGFQADDSGTFLYTNPGDLDADYGEAYRVYGARLANNSIGTNLAINGLPCEYEGDYGVTSMLLDAIVGGSLGGPMRVVFANGNERSSGRCGTTYHTTAPPACAKNPISVGAVNSNDDTMTTFSSWGPTDDGRLKPDLCAPGCQRGNDDGVTSTAINGGYTRLCGTSMACPAVTGMCALVMQEWAKLYPGGEMPLNSTLKALLVQSAVDLGPIGPDYMGGYGSVRVRDAIDLLRAGAVREGGVGQGQAQTFVIRVPSGMRTFKATLAWDDAPAAPNVSAALVNDLDIVAISPRGGVRYYPWTLDPAAPSSPAVRTQPDRVNNLEQVLVNSPPGGNWVIRVEGYSVPVGPQGFSLVTSLAPVGCSSGGVISFDSAKMACGHSGTVTVNDCDLNLDPAGIEATAVRVFSTTDPDGIEVALTETGPDTATFNGTFELSSSSGEGVLRVVDGDMVAAIYEDADNGEGKAVRVSASATADCVPLVISDVVVSEIGARRAVVTYATNKPARASIQLGRSCDALDRSVDVAGFRTQHEVTIDGVQPGTEYRFAVQARDETGQEATDDAGGACYSFVTLEAQDYLTQQFIQEGDAPDHRSITFTPDGSKSFYSACIEPIDELPIDPVGGTWLRNGGEVVLAGGARVSLFGVEYEKVAIHPQGTINFGGWGLDIQTIANHFALPRISALMSWYTPAEKGRLSYKQLEDRLVVTGEHVWGAVTQEPSTYQVEMFFDGRIRLSWLEIGAYRPIIGLSPGGGVPADFGESDFKGLRACVVDGLVVQPSGPLSAYGLAGGPFLPTCRDYLLTNHSTTFEAIGWTGEGSQSWITVSPPGGDIPWGASADVTVCIGEAADQLPAREMDYLGQVGVTNTRTGVVQTRGVQLMVGDSLPPVASDVLAVTTVGTAVDVVLAAEDDGQPSPPVALTFNLVAPPAHGQLAGVGEGHVWTYRPEEGFAGIDRFTYRANDGGEPPRGGGSNEAQVIVRVVAPPRMPESPDPPDGASGVPIHDTRLSLAVSEASLRRSAIVAAAWSLGASDPHFTDPRDKLMGTGLFNEVGIIDVGLETPQLDDLRAFDSVIVWSDAQFADPAVLGDRLADYVDGGGGVVVAVFANTAARSYGNLIGRFVSGNYFCIDYPTEWHVGAMLDGPQTVLGAVLDPFHATMAGVDRFDGGFRSFRPYSSYLAPKARLVAGWSDGAPLVAVRDVNGTPRVDLGMYPVSSDVEADFWDATTDGARLLGNALAYAGKRSGVGVVYDVYFGTDNPPVGAIARDLPIPVCPAPGPLTYGTTYYWRVIARNLAGSVEGPVCSFSTSPASRMDVSDSVPEPDDRRLPFGEVALGSARTEQVTVCNGDSANDLIVTGVGLDAWPTYREDFNDGAAQDWLPTHPEVWQVVAGEYRASAAAASETLESAYQGTTWQDGWVRFKLRRTCGPTWAAAVAFRASDDFSWRSNAGTAYLVGISGNRSFYVGRYVDGQFAFIQPWGMTTSLKQLTGTNEVTVNVLGSRITVYFNGVRAWSGTDDSIAAAGRLSLMGYGGEAGPEAAYLFDDVEVGQALALDDGQLSASVQPILELGGGVPTASPDLTALIGSEEMASWTAGVETADAGSVLDWARGFRIDSPPEVPFSLGPGVCMTVAVTFSPPELGDRQCGLYIESNDADEGRIGIELSGFAGEALVSIEPVETQYLFGPEGGPIEPACIVYTLRNAGENPVDWFAETEGGWLTVEPAGGTLAAGSSVEVQVCANEAAATLPPGPWFGAVIFHDSPSSLGQRREIELNVCGLPQPSDTPSPADGEQAVDYAPTLQWSNMTGEMQVCQAIGLARPAYTLWNHAVGSVVTVTTRQTLLEFRIRLSVGQSTTLYPIVSEAASREGPYVPLSVGKVRVAGVGERGYSSGRMHLTLEPGKFYGLAMAWGSEEIGFGLDYRPCPVEWGRGTIEGVVYDYAIPPAVEALTQFTDVAFCPVDLCFLEDGGLTYDVYLGRPGEELVRVCEDAPGPACTLPWPLDYLTPYVWKVVAVNACGVRESQTWSFETGSCFAYPPMIDRRVGRGPVLRRMHAEAGPLDLDLAAAGAGFNLPIENRKSDVAQIVLHCTRPVQAVGGADAGDVRLKASPGAFAEILDVRVVGDEVTIDLGQLSNGQYALTLPGIADADDAGCPVEDTLCFAVLTGDANGDGVVNTSDYIYVRGRIGLLVDATSLRADVNCDGQINAIDMIVIRGGIGQMAGGCP